MTDEAKANEIIRLMAEEGKSLRKAAEATETPYTTAWNWINSEAYSDQYARAREERGLVLAEETLEIADDPNLDPQDKRVRIDTRKWFASKLNSKQLGEKLDLNHGGQANNPLTLIERRIVQHSKPEDGEQ